MLNSDPKRDAFESLRVGGHAGALSVKELLDLPHYALVRAVAERLRDGEVGQVGEFFDVLAASSACRAAIVMSDLYGLTKRGSLNWSDEVLNLRARSSWAPVEEALRDLPTIDAHEFRTEILNHDRRESALQQLSMVTHLRGEHSGNLREPFRYVSYSHLVSVDEDRDLSIGALLATTARARYNPVLSRDTLTGRSRALCDEFSSAIQGTFFPASRYGYGAHADALRLETPASYGKDSFRYRALGGDAGASQRLLAARLNAKVLVPWPETPDLPPSIGHQCVDSASSARSFFVGRGIPADVYLIQIGSLYHNVCVAFFKEDGRFTPVVIDASPFEGAYSLAEEGGARLWRPQLIESVYGVRRGGLPLVADPSSFDFGRRGATASGFLPWSCEELPEGRVITFAGIHDEPMYPARCFERGTPEFYGRGDRIRCIGFAVTVVPPIESGFCQELPRISVKWENGAFEVVARSESLSESLRARVSQLLLAKLPRFQETLDRLDIPLGHVTW